MMKAMAEMTSISIKCDLSCSNGVYIVREVRDQTFMSKCADLPLQRYSLSLI